MARSTYIYLVTDINRHPLAAFTVKHELKTWLERNRPREPHIYRIADGGYGKPPQEFEP